MSFQICLRKVGGLEVKQVETECIKSREQFGKKTFDYLMPSHGVFIIKNGRILYIYIFKKKCTLVLPIIQLIWLDSLKLDYIIRSKHRYRNTCSIFACLIVFNIFIFIFIKISIYFKQFRKVYMFLVGDRLLSVNNVSLEDLSHETVVEILHSTPDDVTLVVSQPKERLFPGKKNKIHKQQTLIWIKYNCFLLINYFKCTPFRVNPKSVCQVLKLHSNNKSNYELLHGGQVVYSL